MNRRGFLGSILALGAAPAIVRADSLMRIIPLDQGVILGDYAVVTGSGSLTISEIIRQTLIARAGQFTDNVTRGNALLLKMKSKGLIQPVDYVERLH